MSVTEIKDELHKAIESISDREFLAAMLTLISSRKELPEEQKITDAQLSILREREVKYENGEMKATSLEEFKTKMERKHGLSDSAD
jgi:hypothetical protein